jgi:hypothetical protein
MEIPKHLSPEERHGILMKKIGYVSDEVYKGIAVISIIVQLQRY